MVKNLDRFELVEKMEEIQLKNCPFCGQEMKPGIMCFEKAYEKDYQEWLKANHKLPSVATGYDTGWVVHCYYCGAQSSASRTIEEAAELWNRRV